MSIVEYEAYQRVEVASKLPLEIQALATHRAKVLAGAKNGCLLIYEPQLESRRTYDVTTCRSFGRNKAITQLQVALTHDLLLCLTDAITVHDTQLVNYPCICSVVKSKGATQFDSLTDAQGNVLLAAAVRRKLQLYIWHNRQFLEIAPTDLQFADTVHRVCWCDAQTLCVAVGDEYFLVTLKQHSAAATSAKKVLDKSQQEELTTITPLFAAGGRNTEPCMLVLRNRDKPVLALLREDTLVFVDWKHKQIDRDYQQIKWSDAPLSIVYDDPYLVAILAKSGRVEVRSVRPSYCVQRIAAQPTPKLMTIGDPGKTGSVFQAAGNHIWLLTSQPGLRSNAARLTRDKHYELAIQIAEQIDDESVEDRTRRINGIQHKYALHLFAEKQFGRAFDLWSSIDSEEVFLISLFPGLLPENVRENILGASASQPQDLLSISLSDAERKQGLRALTAYLSEVRTRIAYGFQLQPKLRLKCETQKTLSDAESKLLWSPEQLEANQSLLSIVDTTLLKCYLETNDMLVSSLLRLKDNSCNVPETEKLLLSRKKYSELFLLYERKKMHTQALSLLRQQYDKPDSPLSGLDRTINYLQNLGPENLPLIFEHATWVIRKNVEEGINVFIEECDDCRQLDRHKVLSYLLRNTPDAVIPYLEHIIYQWEEERPLFHDTLAEHLVVRVKQLMVQFVESLPEGHDVPPAGHEPGDLGDLRRRLLQFFERSLQFNPERLLVQLPHDALFEERALLLGRLRRHEQAIAIYTNILHDYEAAEKYCRMHYSAGHERDRTVYLTLLRMYASPADTSIVGLLHSSVPKPRPNIAQALRVLKRHASRIDTVEALAYIPDSISLSSLWLPLECVLHDTAAKHDHLTINKGLFAAGHLSAREHLMREQSCKIEITNAVICKHCDKKISNSAFVRNCDGSIVHYFCHRQLTLSHASSTDQLSSASSKQSNYNLR